MAGRFNNSDVAWLIPFRPVVAKESRVLCFASHGYLHVAFTPERGGAPKTRAGYAPHCLSTFNLVVQHT